MFRVLFLNQAHLRISCIPKGVRSVNRVQIKKALMSLEFLPVYERVSYMFLPDTTRQETRGLCVCVVVVEARGGRGGGVWEEWGKRGCARRGAYTVSEWCLRQRDRVASALIVC